MLHVCRRDFGNYECNYICLSCLHACTPLIVLSNSYEQELAMHINRVKQIFKGEDLGHMDPG